MKFTAKSTNNLSTALAKAEEQKREQAALTLANNKDASKTLEQIEREKFGFIEPDNPAVKDRIHIIFDDSGSMNGQSILDAHAGTQEFLKNCEANKVAVAVYPMNMEPIILDTNLPKIAALVPLIKATGGTPMFVTLKSAQNTEIKATRYIIFSDGQPNHDDMDEKEPAIKTAIESKTPIDTVFISTGNTEFVKNSTAYLLMKEIAERTNGIFLFFDRNKVNFRDAFKYLSPGLRLQLTASASFKDAVEAGRIK